MPTDWLDYEGDRSSSKSVAMLAEGVLERIGHSNIHRVHATAMSDQANVTIHYNGGDIEASVEADDNQTLGRVVGELLRNGFKGEETEYELEEEYNVGERAKFGEVFKPFSHEEAVYVPPDNLPPSGDGRCKDCAHFDGHGNCHIVPDIDPEGTCEEFYADVGFFADGVTSLPDPEGKKEPPDVNLALWGENLKRIGGSSAGVIVEDIREKFEEKIGPSTQFIRD